MNELDIPIDIHTGKFQDWLVSRRIIPKTWNERIRDIRNKISNAVNDMPSHDELVVLLSGAHINYFHCLQIVEILKTTEVDTKTVFGRYGSQRMKDWFEILKLYEKDNVYLGEAAQILVRNLQYEIPGIKKQVSKLEQLSDESQKKIQDLGKTEHILNGERTALLQELGVQGVNLMEELTERVKQLPEMHENIAKSLPKIRKAVTIYSEFCNNNECLPLIRHILDKGDTTVYEYAHGEAPLTVIAPVFTLQLNVLTNDEQKSENTIDFGGVNDNDNIDFGDIMNANDITLDTGDIDWGIDDQVIETISLDESGIVVENSGLDGGIAKGDEAISVLDSPSYRDQFIDEVVELEAFLKMRLYELNTLGNSTTISFSLIDGVSTHDADSIAGILKNVQEIYQQATSDLLQHLHRLKYSPKYADILVGKLQQKLRAVQKIKDTRVALKEKIESLSKEKQKLLPLISKMIGQTKLLQNQIESDISKRYKGRSVNLLGRY